jgi:hypothetical protein
MTTIVTGIYRSSAAADSALKRLTAEGFSRDAISLVLASTPHHEQLVQRETHDIQRGVIAGVVAGGLFASLLVGALSLPGIGFLAVGPLAAALAAGGAGAAAGGALGALVGHDLSVQTAQEYETALQNGGILLVVHTDRAHHRRALDVLGATGADLISESVRLGHEREASA